MTRSMGRKRAKLVLVMAATLLTVSSVTVASAENLELAVTLPDTGVDDQRTVGFILIVVAAAAAGIGLRRARLNRWTLLSSVCQSRPMLPQLGRLFARSAASLTLTLGVACGGGSSSSSLPPQGGDGSRLAAGAVTVIALGDSLTAGDGDDSGQGFVGQLTQSISAEPGRAGSTLVNLGQSGWDSTHMVDGMEKEPPQLRKAVEETRSAVGKGRAVLATVLIGSNDMWYLYNYGQESGTTAADEDAAVATYRKNLERAVRELRSAGAFVVIGLPDDQTLRPVVADFKRLQPVLPFVTKAEVRQMSSFAKLLGTSVQDIARDNGLLTVDTNGPFWSDPKKMDEDGIHPNGAGYADLAALWMQVIKPLL